MLYFCHSLLFGFVLCLFRFKLEMNEHKCVMKSTTATMTISQQQPKQEQQIDYAILEKAK